jgi:hypothetical protein
LAVDRGLEHRGGVVDARPALRLDVGGEPRPGAGAVAHADVDAARGEVEDLDGDVEPDIRFRERGLEPVDAWQQPLPPSYDDAWW